MKEKRQGEERRQGREPRPLGFEGPVHASTLRGFGTWPRHGAMGLGVPELLIILAVILILFGPGKLPGLGSGIGSAIRNFRKAVNEPDSIDVTPKSDADRDSGSGRS